MSNVVYVDYLDFLWWASFEFGVGVEDCVKSGG
jgi:hypothetical protein